SRDSTSPSDDLRDQILRDLSPEDRFLDLIDEVETRLDLSESEARRLLAALDDESNWISVPGYDIDLFGFRFVGIEPGPQVEAELAALLRVARGATFPEHEHVGREQVFVLQGTLIEDDGEVFDRGELIEHDHETSHTFSVPDDSPDLIGIVCVEHGLLIDGIPLGDVI
ncbi:MAG: cupin domain-containing protein, partial [Bradymonadaceae bacterium]